MGLSATARQMDRSLYLGLSHLGGLRRVLQSGQKAQTEEPQAVSSTAVSKMDSPLSKEEIFWQEGDIIVSLASWPEEIPSGFPNVNKDEQLKNPQGSKSMGGRILALLPLLCLPFSNQIQKKYFRKLH